MKEGIERNWGADMFPSDEEITHAKWLGLGNESLLLKFIANIILSFILEARAILDTDTLKPQRCRGQRRDEDLGH